MQMKMLSLVLLGLHTLIVDAAPANPLVRPAALAARNGNGTGPVGNAAAQPSFTLPPVPPAPGAGTGDLKTASSGQPGLSRYAVSAIMGDQAVLRISGTNAAAPADPATSSQMNGYSPAAASASSPAVTTPPLLVKHKQKFWFHDQALIPEISADRVVIRPADEPARVLYSGRLEASAGRPPRTITLEQADAAYVSRHTQSGSSTNSSSSAAGGTQAQPSSANPFGAR